MITNIKFWILAGFIFLSAFSANSQNTRRGFKLLEKAEFEKAAELFHDALTENADNPAAVFGLMLIQADEKTSFFNLIDAWKHGSRMSSLIEKLSADDLEYLGEYFYNTEERHISRPVKKKIEYAVETVEAKLIKYIREENNLELVYKVLKEFPDFKHYDNVVHIRNQLEFRKYEKMNTLEGYTEFIHKFPDAAQLDKANRYINRLSYENALKINTPDSYRKYIRDFPEAEEVNQATKQLHAVAFAVAAQKNTIQALDDYISEFPDALEISEARKIQKQLLYEYAKKIQTLEAYNDFIRKYPEGQQYIDIFNLKSLDNGMHFLSTHPISDNILWARSFEDEEVEELSSCITTDSLNNYIIGSTVQRTDTGFTDVWLVKTNSDGKMIWNKFVGEEYDDGISLITVNHNNEIFGAGYTCSGKDSSSRESWIFKLGADGTKLWSRKLGKMHITVLLPALNGSLYAGGYLVNDSLQELYSIAVLNNQGKRLWGRTYTGKGRISDIDETEDGNFILTGNHWYARINPGGYLSAEYQFNEDSIAVCLPVKNSLNFLSMRDSVKMILVGLDQAGKLIPEKIVPVPEAKSQILSVVPKGIDSFVILVSYFDYQSVNTISLSTGKVLTSLRLPADVHFDTLAIDRQNNLLISGCTGQVIILKNKGTTF